MKAAIVILLVACMALGAGLLYRHRQALMEKDANELTICDLSNRVEKVRGDLETQEKIAMILETNLSLTTLERGLYSNKLLQVSADLVKTQKDAEAAAEAAKVEMAKRDARISELTGTIDKQDKELVGLNDAINGLSKQISMTERKLAASEGDREFLLKELKRLQTEKADLERQFNDLATLRAQVSKLREELSVARRLEWIRSGIYGNQERKGANALMTPNSPTPVKKDEVDLNVELKQDAGAIIIPKSAAPPK